MEMVNMLLSVLFVSGALAQCNRNPALFITAPQTMEALSGSCLMIPCNFNFKGGEKFISIRATFGIWIKNDSRFEKNANNVVYNSSRTRNIYPMRITGDLSQRNCTTLFSDLNTTYSDTYFFRIENGPVKATASCNGLQITVRDAPQSPSIEIPGDLKEGDSVTISCSAFTPCPQSPPKLTWTLQQNPHSNTQENTDGSFTTRIQETITLSEQHDGNIISCSASYPVNEGGNVKTAETQASLSVSYAPKDTSASISPSGLVSAGTWVNLTCSSRAKPPVSSFTWFQISTNGTMTVSEGAVYSFNATAGGAYYCVAANALGNQTSPQIRLTIEGSGGTDQLSLVIVGGVTGLIIISVVVGIWWIKSKHPSPQTQGIAAENAAPQKPATEDGTMHYGEINFSSLRPEVTSGSVKDSGQQQDTVYAQVRVSKTAQGSTRPADGPEDLYAQVNKK